MTPTKRARAFTLLELLVASVIAVILLTIVVGLFHNINRGTVRARRLATLAREGGFAARIIGQDLRNAGLGVPRGGHIQRRCGAGCTPVYGSIPPARFYASVLVAAADQVGVLGDIARPNAQYSTYGALASFRSGGADVISWHTENNGLCVPRQGGPTCNTGDFSFFFPGEDGCVGNAANRTCPWGLGRVQAGDRIQIAAGDTNWSHAQAASPLAIRTYPTAGNLVGLALSVPFDRGGTDQVWFNDDKPGAGPGGIAGSGWVTTLDRVFYRLDGAQRTLLRVQCWGDPDPDNVGWPDETGTTIPALATLAITPSSSGASVAKNECTGEEVVARFVEAFQLRYFDKDGNAVAAPAAGADKARIRRIDYRIVLRIPGDLMTNDVIHEAVGSARLNNL